MRQVHRADTNIKRKQVFGKNKKKAGTPCIAERKIVELVVAALRPVKGRKGKGRRQRKGGDNNVLQKDTKMGRKQ